jgi:RimJ/RimL family protein N-acetyltransferase
MIRLEYLEKEDLKEIVEWNANKSADYLTQWAGPSYSYPLTLEQIENCFLNDSKKYDSNINAYKIRITDTDEFIGAVELREIDRNNKIGRVCRLIIGEEKFRSKGIGTQALKELLRIGFKNLNFEKVTLGVYDFNHSAIKCYEKAGFVKEKFLENATKAATGYWNSYEMAISKGEWQTKNE